MEDNLLAVDDDRVSRIRTPAETRGKLHLASEDVDELPFPLIAPVEAENSS